MYLPVSVRKNATARIPAPNARLRLIHRATDFLCSSSAPVIAPAATTVGGICGILLSSASESRWSAYFISVTRREQFGHWAMCCATAESPGMSVRLVVEITERHSAHVVMFSAPAMQDDPEGD